MRKIFCFFGYHAWGAPELKHDWFNTVRLFTCKHCNEQKIVAE